MPLPWEKLPMATTINHICGFRGLVVDYIAAPQSSGNTSELHSQTNCYATARLSVGHFRGTKWVYMKYRPGFTLRLGYGDSEKSPLNLHY